MMRMQIHDRFLSVYRVTPCESGSKPVHLGDVPLTEDIPDSLRGILTPAEQRRLAAKLHMERADAVVIARYNLAVVLDETLTLAERVSPCEQARIQLLLERALRRVTRASGS